MDITLQRILTLLPTKPDGKFVRGSKKDFAVSIGYDSGDIVSMWINGSSTSYKGKLYEIADKYNVSAEWLKGETDIKEKKPRAQNGHRAQRSQKSTYSEACLYGRQHDPSAQLACRPSSFAAREINMDITLQRILTLLPTKPDGKFVHGAKKEFAGNIGLKSGNLISDWMNGRSKSYINYVYEISAKYNVSVEWLKGETDIKEKSPVPEMGAELSGEKKALIHKIALIDDNMIQALNSLADQVLLLREK